MNELSFIILLALFSLLITGLLIRIRWQKRQNVETTEASKKLQEDIQNLQEVIAQKREEIAGLKAQLLAQQEVNSTLETEKNKISNQLRNEFELIATKIFKTQSLEFKDINRESLHSLLNPLHEKIKGFETVVKEIWDKEQRESISLKHEVKTLTALNQQLSQETGNLTKALKSDSKQQGNWGEMILESILEKSGLQKGVNFETQYSTLGEDGQRIQPDVIIRLPDKKHIIIDAKVSLTAYERFINAEDENSRNVYIHEHIKSVKNHIHELHKKNYQQGKGLNSPDFILLFIPVESSFSTAVKADENLFSAAWDKNIVIVSPSTLLATLMTIANIWRQENQNENAKSIAIAGGQLYDKVAGIINDYEKLYKNLQTVDNTMESINRKLRGQGGLVSKVETMKQMGARATKSIDKGAETKEKSTFVE
ncbi:MAG: DNA recombination protein RmuC [Bacteroidales bacterium]|nr:DNA recombination protein RmuC [Bacteroidales bacterium]